MRSPSTRLVLLLGMDPWIMASVNHPALRKLVGLQEDPQMGKAVNYPDQNQSLHPMAGMKNVVTIDGTEPRFELSEAARRRRELAKRASQSKKKGSFRKKKIIAEINAAHDFSVPRGIQGELRRKYKAKS